jgi:hypothetical protein
MFHFFSHTYIGSRANRMHVVLVWLKCESDLLKYSTVLRTVNLEPRKRFTIASTNQHSAYGQ